MRKCKVGKQLARFESTFNATSIPAVDYDCDEEQDGTIKLTNEEEVIGTVQFLFNIMNTLSDIYSSGKGEKGGNESEKARWKDREMERNIMLSLHDLFV